MSSSFALTAFATMPRPSKSLLDQLRYSELARPCALGNFLGVFGQDIDLDIKRIAGGEPMEIGGLVGVGNDGDTEHIPVAEFQKGIRIFYDLMSAEF